MSVSIEIAGRELFIRRTVDLGNKLRTKVARRMAQMAYDLSDRAADKHTKSGTLRRSLRLISTEQGYWVGHDTQHAPHAKFVHWGTRPHQIRPKFRKSLRFPVGTGGATKFVFAKRVNHPGYKGDPYLERVARRVAGDMARIVHSVTGA